MKKILFFLLITLASCEKESVLTKDQLVNQYEVRINPNAYSDTYLVADGDVWKLYNEAGVIFAKFTPVPVGYPTVSWLRIHICFLLVFLAGILTGRQFFSNSKS